MYNFFQQYLIEFQVSEIKLIEFQILEIQLNSVEKN